MIDLKLLRENADVVRANCARRHCPIDFDTLLSQEKLYRELNTDVEELRAKRNRLSKECKDNPAARDEMRLLRDELGRKEAVLNRAQEKLQGMLDFLPNLLAPDVPDGTDDMDNVELRKVGAIPTFDFKPRDHQELGEMLDILDIARGAKVAAAGFYYWKGKGAQLAQALYFWVQQELIKRGFTLFMTPCAAKTRTLYGTGYLPFFADQTFNLAGLDLALIGTSEQTLVGYHADDVLEADELPLRYTALTRARNLVVLVGSEEIIQRMVKNDHVARRYTTLALRLCQAGENA